MNRKKRTRTSRKSSPLSIDLRDFLMYSNPSMFAPKVRANGGEAYPQAPTMNQFFDYGHPTPQVPFVFQTGGMMDFSEGADDRRANFLNKIKEAAANAVQKEFENEAFDYEDQANAMFQSGGPFNMDFSKANAWASAQQPSNFYNAASNFATLWDAAQSGPTETYIKRWKQQQLPIAQTGLQNEDPTAGMTRDERLAYEREKRGYNSDPRFMLPPSTSNSQGIKNQALADQRAREMGLDPLTGKMLGKDMTPILEKDPADWRNNMMIPANQNEPRTVGEDLQPMQPRDMTPIRPGANANVGRGIVQDAVLNLQQKVEADRKKREEAAKAGLPPEGTGTKTNPDGTQSSTAPEKKEEGKKEDGTVPAPGSKEESDAAAAAGMSPEQYRTFLTRATVNNRRAILPGNRLRSMDFYFDTYGPGMNPITASANKQKPFFYDDATGKMEGATPNSNQSNPRGRDRGNGNFLADLFARKGNYRGPQDNVSPADLANQERALGEKSQYDPRGYNSEYSDFRNQVFQNRRNRLGERLDRLYANADQMNQLYGQEPSQGYFDKIKKLENRYDRIGEGRVPDVVDTRSPDLMWRMIDEDQRRKAQPFNFGSNYARPQFNYGGYLKQYQDAGPVTFEDEYIPESETDIEGNTTSLDQTPQFNNRVDYSGSDKPLSETYIGDIAPVDLVRNNSQMMGKKIGSNKMTAIFGHYNPYEAPMMLAGLQATAGLMDRRNQRKLQGEWMGKTSADQVYTKDFEKDRGDYTMNEGYFRPDDMVPVKNAGYNFQSFNAKMGGSYKKGGEYYLSDEEIQRIIDMGGEVEFLED